MPANKKPKKKYCKKISSPDPVQRVLSGFIPVSSLKDEIISHKTKQIAAMNKLKSGNAAIKDIDVLIDMINLSESYKQLGHIGEHYGIILAARKAIINMASRKIKLGRFIAKGDEIRVLTELMELYDAQLNVLTVREVEDVSLQMLSAYKTENGCGIKLNFNEVDTAKEK